MSHLRALFSRRVVLVWLAAVLAAVPLAGAVAAAAVPAKLDGKQKAEVARVETYLNGIRTMRSRFLQVADNGATDQGTVLLSRPGLMRIEYDPPSPHLIIANGTFLIYHEKKLNQTSYLPLSSSLAGFLVRDTIRLSGDVTVTGFEEQRGVIRISLVKTDDAAAGRLTLVFSDQPLQLRQWIVTDSEGVITRITLVNPEFGVPIDKKQFEFTPPERRRQSD